VQNDRRTGTFIFTSSQIVLSGGTSCAIRGTIFRKGSDTFHVIAWPLENFIATALKFAKISRTNGQFILNLMPGARVFELTGIALTVPTFIVLRASLTSDPTLLNTLLKQIMYLLSKAVSGALPTD
jgi:hypothetical protein